jgi:hypothetical protein
MRQNDFDEFAQLLQAAFDLLGKTPAAKVVSPTAQALFFQALADYPLPAVRAGLANHIKRGKFTPTPAAVVEFLEAARQVDNRPGGEEAWALALTTLDEAKTVVWTQEAAEAFGIAGPVLSSSGAISARKTFLEVYERLITASRKNGIAAHWFVSPGSDMDSYQLALKNGVAAGFLPAPDVPKALSAPVDEKPCSLSPREQLHQIQTMLLAGIQEKQRQADEEIKGRIEEEDEFKRDLSRRVRDREAYIRMADQAQVVREEGKRVRHAAD